MKLRTRLLAGHLISSLLILALGAAILATINTVSPVVDELDREVISLGQAVSLSRLSGRIVSLRTELSQKANQFIQSQDLEYKRRYDRAALELSDVFDQAIKSVQGEDDATIFRNLRQTSRRLGTLEREMINLAGAKKIDEAETLSHSKDYVELNVAISDFVAILASRKQADSSDIFSRLIEVSRTTDTNRENLNTLAIVTMVSVVLSLIASITIGAFIARSISRPLTVLKEGADAIGKGDLGQRIGMSRTDEIGIISSVFDYIGGNSAHHLRSRRVDEIGEVATAFNEMAQRLQQTMVYKDELLREIADRRLAQIEAEQANRAKTEFLAAMSHELRTPLNAIIGFSEIIKDEIFGPVGSAQYRNYAGDIHESGQHLLDLINDILDLSKIESGTDELHEDEIEIPEIIHSALKLVGQRAERGGVKLELELVG